MKKNASIKFSRKSIASITSTCRKSQNSLNKISRKGKKLNWEKIASFLKCNTSDTIALNEIKRVKGIKLNKVSILEVNRVQCKDCKSIA